MDFVGKPCPRLDYADGSITAMWMSSIVQGFQLEELANPDLLMPLKEDKTETKDSQLVDMENVDPVGA